MNDQSTMTLYVRSRAQRASIAALALCCCIVAGLLDAQAPAPGATSAGSPAAPAAEIAPPSKPTLELGSLAWLEGCWRGEVNKYEFREHWLPLRGDLMVGAGHVVYQGKTEDYGYLRLETRADGVYYVSVSGKKEISFKLTTTAVDDRDTIFSFTNPVDEFPQGVVYRRGLDGWLYATVEGKVKGEDKKVIYPMRRVDCQTGEILRR